MHDSARTDLWEPWGSNPPGRPGPYPSQFAGKGRVLVMSVYWELEK